MVLLKMSALLWISFVILFSASTARAGPCSAPPNPGNGTALVVCSCNSVRIGAPVALICGFNAWPQMVVLSMVGTGNVATIFYANGSYYLTASDNVLHRLLVGIYLPNYPPAYATSTSSAPTAIPLANVAATALPITTTAAPQNAASFVLFKFLRTMLSDSGTYFCTANGVNSSTAYLSVQNTVNNGGTTASSDEVTWWPMDEEGRLSTPIYLNNENNRRSLIIAITIPLVFFVLAAVALTIILVLCRKRKLQFAAQLKADEMKIDNKNKMQLAEQNADVEACNNKMYDAPPPSYANVAADPTNC